MNTENNTYSDFAAHKAAALQIVSAAQSEGRKLTEAEKATADYHMDKLAELKDLRQEAIKEAVLTAHKERELPQARSPFEVPLTKGQSLFSAMRFSKPEVSLGHFLRSIVVGPRNDSERFAIQSATDNAGGFQVPPAVAAQFIDMLRLNSVYANAGAMVIPMIDKITASVVTDPTATFRGDGGAVTEATPFTGAALSPKTLSVIVQVPREQVRDSINIESALVSTLVDSMSLAMDSAIGFGGGGTAPSGIASTSGILDWDVAGDMIDYSDMLSALYLLQTNNSNPTAVVMSPREAQTLGGFQDSTYQPLRRPEALASVPFAVSASVPVPAGVSTMLMGDFSRLLIAVRIGLELEILKEKYADTYSYGYQASIRLDSVVTRAKSFCKLSGITVNLS